MRRKLSTFFSIRRGSSSFAMIMLLALAGLAGDRTLIYSLRGLSRPDETENVLPLGYYETLLQPSGRGNSSSLQPPVGWLPFGGESTGIVEEQTTYLRWNMKPNLDLRWNGTVFRTNGLGFRTPDVSTEKPAGTYRIVVFGSSNSMGYGVSNHEIYTYLMEEWLRSRVGPSRRVEVVNLSVAGDSPSRRLYRLRQEAQRFHPDWLICDASSFDSWLEDTHIQGVVDRRTPGALSIRRGSHSPDRRHAGRDSGILPDQVPGRVRADVRPGLCRLERRVETLGGPADGPDPPSSGQQGEVSARAGVDPFPGGSPWPGLPRPDDCIRFPRGG